MINYILIIAGIVFALIGIILFVVLLYKKADTAADNSIQFLGINMQTRNPALIIFVVGVALIVFGATIGNNGTDKPDKPKTDTISKDKPVIPDVKPVQHADSIAPQPVIIDTIVDDPNVRRVQFFNNNYKSRYIIVSLKDTAVTEKLGAQAELLRDSGFDLTEIAQDTKGNFYVITYGYRDRADGPQRHLQKIADISSSTGYKAKLTDLTNLAPDGFVKKIEKGNFAYFIPRKVEE